MPISLQNAFRIAGVKALTDITATKTKEIFLLQERWEQDDTYGLRKFRIIRPDGVLTVGVPASFEIAQAAAASATAGSTTTISDTGAFTADAFNSATVGPCWAHVVDDAGAAGAAPEGEISLITSNTADVLTLSTALTAAVAVNDTYVVIRVGVTEASAAADGAAEVAGIIMATSHTADNYGWAQFYGFHEAIAVTATTAETAGVSFKTGASLVTGISADTTPLDYDTAIGVFLGGDRASDTVRDFHAGYIFL